MCTQVAIIERGELRFKGAVGSAQKTVANSVRYRLRVLDDAGKVEHFLVQQPFVEKVVVNGQELLVHYESDEANYSQLLGAVIQQGYRVVESRLVQSNLEEAFLAMTQGEME
jgi:ABC-type multidrug transport system ATPase subunit